jgi:PIN domain nuclease of toxin-antitoxin system
MPRSFRRSAGPPNASGNGWHSPTVCCLATGLRLNLPVVGGDQAWERLRLGIDVHPIR